MKASEVEEKLGRLRSWMEGAGYGAVALGRQTHVAWLGVSLTR